MDGEASSSSQQQQQALLAWALCSRPVQDVPWKQTKECAEEQKHPLASFCLRAGRFRCDRIGGGEAES